MATDPTLMFCVGATKAGTSWLYEFLHGHPSVHLRGVKELHYFDVQERQSQSHHIGEIQKRIGSFSNRLAGKTDARRAQLQGQIVDSYDLIDLFERDGEDTAAYLGYLNHGRNQQGVIGDITPAYGLLSVERLAKMAKLAVKTRFIYILRDPVDRLWSHIRMIAGRKSVGSKNVQGKADEIFAGMGQQNHRDIWDRSDYRGALTRLNAALDPSQLLVLFYEELFSYSAIERICEFLGIPLMRAKLGVPVHVGPDATMTDNQRRQAQLWLAPQYEYVNNRLGNVPAEWQANMSGATL